MKIKTSNILENGNSLKLKTGDWRNRKPVQDSEKCKDCMFCVAYCPEGCISQKDGKFEKINLDYCKGCGVCAKVCPFKAISMEEEK